MIGFFWKGVDYVDCTFVTEKGKFNFRVGAVIMKGSSVLMARNPNESRVFYYSVGGRVKFGERLEDSILREIKEETGIDAEIDKMAFIHENFFSDDDGTFFHEISVFFYIKPNEMLFNIKNGHLTDKGPLGEYLEWIDLSEPLKVQIYPEFFKNEVLNSTKEIKHIVTYQN